MHSFKIQYPAGGNSAPEWYDRKQVHYQVFCKKNSKRVPCDLKCSVAVPLVPSRAFQYIGVKVSSI